MYPCGTGCAAVFTTRTMTAYVPTRMLALWIRVLLDCAPLYQWLAVSINSTVNVAQHMTSILCNTGYVLHYAVVCCTCSRVSLLVMKFNFLSCLLWIACGSGAKRITCTHSGVKLQRHHMHANCIQTIYVGVGDSFLPSCVGG